MKNYSIWKDTVNLKKYEKLKKDISCDVLIIGGGITGVSTLFQLEKSNLEVVLVEQNKIGMGVTGNTTGKLNYLQDSIYDKIISLCGEEKASLYLKSQLEAIDLAVLLINKNNISCDLEKANAYLYTNLDNEIEKIKKLENFFHKHGIHTFEDKLELVKSKYMFYVENTYLFHPLKFLDGLLGEVSKGKIFEGTSIQKIEKNEEGYVCITSLGKKIKTKWVVLASHYPYFNFPYLFPIRGSLEKSYISASPYKGDDVSLISYTNPVISIRNYKDYLLYLSNSHKNSHDVVDKKNYEDLLKKVKDLGYEPEYLWSNIDIMTNDGLPYIGEIKDKLLIGTGYNTWGMTNGILSGKILSDLILEKNNEYLELFDPKRISLGMVTSVVIDGIDNVVGYINGYMTDSKKIEYREVDGKEIAIYRDDEKEHIVYTKCPHMGCRLIFNEIEKTWDCPCHASRFDMDGKCINGPSNQDITYHS